MTEQFRISHHPILPALPKPDVLFTFNGKPLLARRGEVVSSALYAAGVSVFGHHHRDGGAQGVFCVNGQCSQCMVLVDGRPVKACMTVVEQGMTVKSCDGFPSLPLDMQTGEMGRPCEHRTSVLILGGGPAGLCAAIELGKVGIQTILIDDKPELGGKLTLQTHQFFGSVADCWAGTRGVDIGHLLSAEANGLESVQVWKNATAVGVFFDGKVGVSTPNGYRLVHADAVLVALGAREKSLVFPGCDLPGVYGAGAFQTLVNRDLVKSSQRIFILGGGNVGLIGAYHALQAGIDVVGLVEALPEVGGYKVHADKIKRLGVPVWTSHTVLRADPKPETEVLGSVTIAQVDKSFSAIAGTEKTFDVDTLLVAVGLSPCDELLEKATQLGIKVYAAGDTAEIAEASAAIFSGRIIGRKIANDLGVQVSIPEQWEPMAGLLRSRPGRTVPLSVADRPLRVFPVIRCVQEIPCNPCEASCPEGLISLPGSIMNLPSYEGVCLGCGECVSVCPGLAINLVYNDYDPTGKTALLMLPFELGADRVPLGSEVHTVDMEGNPVGVGTVIALRDHPDQDRRALVMVQVPSDDKLKVAGFRVRELSQPVQPMVADDEADPIVCRCERVRKSAIVAEIKAGVRDLNQLKALVRASMGGCGGKTCTELVRRIFREQGVGLKEVSPGTSRPLVAETALGAFVKPEEKTGG